MAKGAVNNNGRIAGILEKLTGTKYLFTYANDYLANGAIPAISLAFPKNQQTYEGKELFAFFMACLQKGSIRVSNAGY